MANKYRGELAFSVDGGASYTLRFGTKEYAAAEVALGITRFAEFSPRLLRMGIVDLATLIGICLTRHHPDLTPAEVMEIIDAAGAGEVCGVTMMAGRLRDVVNLGFAGPVPKPEKPEGSDSKP